MLEEFKRIEGSYVANVSIQGTPVEIDIPSDTLHDNFVNWTYIQLILDVLHENLNLINDRAQKFLRFYTENSGLYSSDENSLIQGFSLEGITIEGPFSENPYLTKYNTRYTLHYDWIANTWVDTYGRFEVYALHTNLEGLRRIQM